MIRKTRSGFMGWTESACSGPVSRGEDSGNLAFQISDNFVVPHSPANSLQRPNVVIVVLEQAKATIEILNAGDRPSDSETPLAS